MLRRLLRIVVWSVAVAIVAVLALVLLYGVVTPVSTLMLARWASGQPVERVAVPLDAVSPHVASAIVASEDARFCQHRGVDWDAIRLVIDDEDGPSRGASTIAMQVSKNLFLWPSRSYIRKALEIPLALAIDSVWGKRRVIENYLNVAEWGDGVFGIEAAARRHFGKSARDLGRAEAGLLAAALPNPKVRNAGRPSPAHRALARTVQARMGAVEVPCV